MSMVLKQANFQIPEDLLKELRETVGKGKLGKFVSQALRRELQRLRQVAAVDESFGSWKSGDHPELAAGVGKFVLNVRKSARGKRPNGTDHH